jgi:hypothetical protein
MNFFVHRFNGVALSSEMESIINIQLLFHNQPLQSVETATRLLRKRWRIRMHSTFQF